MRKRGPYERILQLRRQRRCWRRVACMLAALLAACVIVIVLQWLKLPAQ